MLIRLVRTKSLWVDYDFSYLSENSMISGVFIYDWEPMNYQALLFKYYTSMHILFMELNSSYAGWFV